MAKMVKAKEQAYDEKIFPLMAEIIKICQENKINMAAHFVLDDHPAEDGGLLSCTTAITPDLDDDDGYNKIKKLVSIMKPPTFTAFTITTKPRE